MKAENTLPLLGHLEHVALPELDIFCRAKVDTGACSSSLHADDIEEFERDGRLWVRFQVHFHNELTRIDQQCEYPVHDQRRIKSSNGIGSKRYVIHPWLVIAGIRFQSDVTLSHRGSMKYPALIGRKALHQRFLVDVSSRYLGDQTG
ncbi:ribosomal protein S6 modification protein [Bacterioplanes sanyensis]|uniref:ATP-dependent zinc protease family protein n=1 Tax=Bacterioplanes sanyensis TaxID=1249553 RepID=UPI00167B5EC6|nr:RimK/LysX family protein [Bacterioplanes sanyensis]GGY39906.1 ribosomal protein S6 modification protein [Bacterioplanes sanyensis]